MSAVSIPSPTVLQRALMASPVLLVFVSSNIANAGNLAYNMLFSRWMGPELFGDLALILTIKLSILAVLNAVQMAISKNVAETHDQGKLDAYGALSHAALIGGFFIVPPVAFALWLFDAGSVLNLSDPDVLFVLCAALPFVAPLCFARGVVTGKLSVSAIISSTQVEVLVRLLGGTMAWHFGLGLQGVTLALVFSIIAAWLVIARQATPRGEHEIPKGIARQLALASVPFALMQAAQVALLDGDVLIAKIILSAEEAGLAAALALFQRIEFFACFALASVLLPSVTAATARGDNPLQAAAPVAILFAGVSVSILALSHQFPNVLMQMLAGSEFLKASPLLWPAAITATAFTLSYLVATWLAAMGCKRGIYLLAAFVPVQFASLLAADALAGGLSLSLLITTKLSVHLSLAALMLVVAAQFCATRRHY